MGLGSPHTFNVSSLARMPRDPAFPALFVKLPETLAPASALSWHPPFAGAQR